MSFRRSNVRQAEAKFIALVEEKLTALGATRVDPSLPYEQRKRNWRIETRVGTLWLTPYGTWIAGLFEDWPRAKAAGFGHWKWNHNYSKGAAEDEAEHFARQLQALGIQSPEPDNG